MRLPTLSPLLVALALVAGSPVASAALIADHFVRISAGEVVTAPFTAPATATSGIYAGPVEIEVSGTGFSLFTVLNDAFYGVQSQAQLDAQYYQLNIGWAGFPLVPFSGEPHNIDNFISFIEGPGFVTAPARPAYAANNTYRFVVNVPLLAGALTFGVSDGNFGDNGGAYRIGVWQLAARSVPEPAPIALLALALIALTPCAQRLTLRAVRSR